MPPQDSRRVSRTASSNFWRGGLTMRGSVVQRGSRFYLAVYLGTDPVTKKRRYQWISGFDSKEQAEAARVKVAQSSAYGSGVGPRGSTRLRFGQYLEQWLKTEVPLRCRPSGVRRRESIVRVHLKPTLGAIPLARIAPATIQEFVGDLQGKSARYIFTILRAALRHAVKVELIMADPSANVTPPRASIYEPVVWTAEETVRFLVECRRSVPQWWPVFLLATTSGLRQSEVLALTWRDLDGDTVGVHRGLDRTGGGFRFQNPKSRRSRRAVSLPLEVLADLKGLRRQQIEERLKRGLCSKDGACRDQHCPLWHDHDLICCQPNGKPLHGHNLSYRIMPKIIERAKVPAMPFHGLRRCHGTLLDSEHVSLKVISARLGHHSEAFTLSRYVHTGDEQRQAAGAVSRVLLSNQSLITPGDGAEVAQ